MSTIMMTMNDKPVRGAVEARTRRVESLRGHLRLARTHVRCDTSRGGCCTVPVFGRAIQSRTAPAVAREGAR